MPHLQVTLPHSYTQRIIRALRLHASQSDLHLYICILSPVWPHCGIHSVSLYDICTGNKHHLFQVGLLSIFNLSPSNTIPVSPKFERWHVDFLGPLNPSQEGHKYILLFVDSFSRWCEAFPVKSADAATTASVLYSKIICRYGAQAKLVSDRGTHFVNSLIQSLCDIFGIKRHLSSPYHPCSNAICKRFNSFLNKSLRSYVNDTQSDWPGLIPGILMAYKLTPAMRSTEFSPFFLLFNHEMQIPLDTTLPRVLPDVATQFKTQYQGYYW